MVETSIRSSSFPAARVVSQSFFFASFLLHFPPVKESVTPFRLVVGGWVSRGSLP